MREQVATISVHGNAALSFSESRASQSFELGHEPGRVSDRYRIRPVANGQRWQRWAAAKQPRFKVGSALLVKRLRNFVLSRRTN